MSHIAGHPCGFLLLPLLYFTYRCLGSFWLSSVTVVTLGLGHPISARRRTQL